MPAKTRVLCIGHDQLLLQTRKWMLEKEFEVETADTIGQTFELLNSRTYDLLLLCHSLDDNECKLICTAVFSRAMATRVLQLTEGWGTVRSLIGPEEQTSAAKPQTLVRKISEVIRDSQSPKIGPPDLSGAR